MQQLHLEDGLKINQTNMQADIQGALAQINKSWKCFTHKGEPMTKQQVLKVLIYANNKGYKSTADLNDDEIDKLLKTNQ